MGHNILNGWIKYNCTKDQLNDGQLSMRHPPLKPQVDQLKVSK